VQSRRDGLKVAQDVSPGTHWTKSNSPVGTAERRLRSIQPSLAGLDSFVILPRTDVLGYFHAVPSGLGGRVGYVRRAQKIGNLYRAVQQKQPAFIGQSLLNGISQLHPPTTRFLANLDSSDLQWAVIFRETVRYLCSSAVAHPRFQFRLLVTSKRRSNLC